MTEKRYTNDEITVVWKPETCVHSTICWKGLIRVFNPKERPWINMQGAATEKIIAQIDKCPSGALSYFDHSEGEDSAPVESGSLVEIMENGPLLVHGNLKIKNAEGHLITKQKVTAFCRCGASANKPFCDGSHQKIDFKG